MSTFEEQLINSNFPCPKCNGLSELHTISHVKDGSIDFTRICLSCNCGFVSNWTPKKKNRFQIAVFDIESTGFSHQKDCILEIGGCLLDLETGKIEKLFDEIIKEKRWNIGKYKRAWIFNNSDLNPNDIERKGLSIDEVFDKLQKTFYKYKCVAFNQKFDFGFLRHRGFKIENTLKDPMKIATDILKIPPTEKMKRSGRFHFKTPSVQECLDYFGIKKIEEHRGYSDCVDEAKIILQLYKMGKYTEADLI